LKRILQTRRVNDVTLIQGIFTIFLAIALTLPTNSCEKGKVKDKTKNGTSQSEAATVATNSSVADQRVPEGKWGGPHVRLDVSSAGADFEFDCAHGRLQDPLTLQNGRFATTGTYIRERGPVRIEGKEEGIRAYFKGVVEGNKMTLTFSLSEDGSDAETFTLTHGADARLFKCK
jgi:hypothetical protein